LVGEGKDRNPDPARKIPGSDKIFRPPGDLVGLWLRSWFEKMLLQRCVFRSVSFTANPIRNYLYGIGSFHQQAKKIHNLDFGSLDPS